MKIETKKLQAVVAAVVGALPRRCIIPILTGIRLEVKNFKLIAQATDQDIAATAEIETDGADGSMPPVVIAGKELQKALASAKNSKEIDVGSEQDERVVLKFNGSEIAIPSFKPDQYPMLPEIPDGRPLLTIKSELLRQLCRETLPFVTKEKSRYSLQAVLVEYDYPDSAFVSTDGCRLGYSIIEDCTAREGFKLLIPSDALHMVLKGLPKLNTDVEIRTFTRESKTDLEGISAQTISLTTVFFSWCSGDCTVVAASRLSQGQFPNYNMVLLKPKDIKASAILNTKELLSAMSQAVGVTKDTPSVKFEFSEGSLNLSNKTFKQTLHANTKDAVSAIFNPKYVADFLRAIDTERCSVVWKDHDSQFEFRPFYDYDIGHTYRYVIMPMGE